MRRAVGRRTGTFCGAGEAGEGCTGGQLMPYLGASGPFDALSLPVPSLRLPRRSDASGVRQRRRSCGASLTGGFGDNVSIRHTRVEISENTCARPRCPMASSCVTRNGNFEYFRPIITIKTVIVNLQY
eukprot:scaffold380_cov272-Pinguiococcus_pyrenoidosus.AAC.5